VAFSAIAVTDIMMVVSEIFSGREYPLLLVAFSEREGASQQKGPPIHPFLLSQHKHLNNRPLGKWRPCDTSATAAADLNHTARTRGHQIKAGAVAEVASLSVVGGGFPIRSRNHLSQEING
jgi:hypothetical protein